MNGLRRAIARAAVVVCGVVVAAGCGEDNPAAERETAAEPQVRPVSEVEVARLDLDGGPDWLAADDRGVWVKHDSGELLLVDPESHEAVDSVEIEAVSSHCQGLGTSYDAVWTCAGSDVVKVDPDSLEVTARFKVKKQASQGHLVGAFDRIWVLTSDGGHLVGIDPVDDEIAIEVDLPARCSDVAAGEAGLWLPCPVDDRVLQLDPATGDVLQNLESENPVAVAVDSDVWVATGTKTVRLDPASGEALAEVEVGAQPDGWVALAEDSVWVRNGDAFLFRIDRTTQELAEQITADVTSGGDLIVVNGKVWTTAFDDAALFVLDPTR